MDKSIGRTWKFLGVDVSQVDSSWFIKQAPKDNTSTSSQPDCEVVYEAGFETSKVIRLGSDAFLKINKLIPNTTREHVTLNYIRQQHSPMSFEIPRVLAYAEFDGRYYIIVSRVTGETLDKSWKDMDEPTKDYYVCQGANICMEMEAWQMEAWQMGRSISSIGGGSDLSSSNLMSNCEQIGMDCSRLVCYHCDLAPGNIILGKSIGIIDWETAGFVPREWIRTKFRFSGGLDLTGFEDQNLRVEWRKRMQLKLGEMGFPEVAEGWNTWRTKVLSSFAG